MTSPRNKIVFPLKIIYFLPVCIILVWLIAFFISGSSFIEKLLLVISQFLITIFIFVVLIKTCSPQQSSYGPGLIFIFCLHVLIYYSISNVIPSLLPELRPESLVQRIPQSSPLAYSLATVAAALMLLGFYLGSKLILFLWPQANFPKTKHYAWLPNYKLAMLACLILLILITIGTSLYAAQVATQVLMDEDVAGMQLGEQLLFHGLFNVLPIAPILAAVGCIKAESRGQKRTAGFLFVISGIFTLLVLSIWGQRSTALIAIAIPIGLLIYTKKINLHKTLIPATLLLVLIYSGVTIVRDSDLPSLLASSPDISQISLDEVVSAITTRPGDQDMATRAFTDLSYRTAGLEAVASLIQEQSDSRLSYRWGNTILGGLMQALPASLRAESEIVTRIKTAPAYSGVFQPGDWVTTILAEFVFDFGPLFLFLPAIVCGAFLTLIDRFLFGLAQHSSLEGLLILRIVFLLFIISNGGSFAEMTIRLFKGTFGYTIIFLLLSILTFVSSKMKINKRILCDLVPHNN